MVSVSTARHCHTPSIGLESNVFFEFLVFAQSVITLGCQYLNIYKTVWWLPHSTSRYAVNFHAIDFDLSVLLIIIMSRRFFYCSFKQISNMKSSLRSCSYHIVCIFKVLVVIASVTASLYFISKLARRYTVVHFLFLFYPFITYFILFRFDVRPFFGKLPVQQNTYFKNKPKDYRELPVHLCSTSPEEIRDEVDNLKTDFNGRVTQIVFNSMFCTYYMTCIPLCFAQGNLHYDMWWAIQYVVMNWLGMLILFANHFLPVKYLDVFHRCSLHLGHWSKIEPRVVPHTSHGAWSELQLFPQGSTVKHVKGLFRAEGQNNAAEPGNVMHSRFYHVFRRPLRVTNGILVFALLLILYEFFILIQSAYWNTMLSLVFLLFPNYLVLYKVLRNKFVVEKIYEDM